MGQTWNYLGTTPPTGFSASDIKACYQFDGPTLGLTDRTGNGHDLSTNVSYGYAWHHMGDSYGCNGFFVGLDTVWLLSPLSATLGTLGEATMEFAFARYRMGNMDDTYNGYMAIGGDDETEDDNICFCIYGSATRNRLGFLQEYGAAGANSALVNPDFWAVGCTGQMVYIAATRDSDGVTFHLYVDGVYLCDTVLPNAPTGATNVRVYIGCATGAIGSSSQPGVFNSARWSHGKMTTDQIAETYAQLRAAA